MFSLLERLANIMTFSWLGFAPDTYIADAVYFFIYDLIKIGFLLVLINFIMAVSRYYFPMEKVRDILTKRRWYGSDYLLAALLGVVTPFCSCSSIPLFVGFLSAGIPLGVTFTFLISSPLVNEASLYLFPAVFGLKATILYNLTGIGISVFGGLFINRLKMEKYVRPEFLRFKTKKQVEAEYNDLKVPLNNLLKHWGSEAMGITRKVFPYIVLGVAIGALIHGFVPQDLILRYLSLRSWWVIPVAVFIGAPLYANSVGVIPIMEALIGKGIPMGTALAFMTSIVTISIPEGLILAKLMKKQLLFAFFAITISGIILMGYLFNWIL